MFPKKIENYVFDESTHKSLYKLSCNKIIDEIVSPIASGKEAICFLGYNQKNPLVAKIYKMETSTFKNLDKYIIGDKRFKNIKKDRRDLFLVWANKEFKNLTLALKNNVSVPVPIAKDKNVLIMSFIGENDKPFKRLKDASFDYETVYNQIIDEYAKLLYAAKLVHADFSSFNILINPTTQKITIIDMGQAVLLTHPNAQEFLKRDIINITDFLNKKFRNLNLNYETVLNDIKQKKDIYGRNNKNK